jgi:hypothetical protein
MVYFTLNAMDQERAVKLKMLEIKMEDVIPKKFHWRIRDALLQMYVVGRDSNNAKETNGCQKPIIQLDHNKKKIKEYPSASSACRQLHVPKSTILSAVKDGHKTRHDHYWVYVEDYIETPNRT